MGVAARAPDAHHHGCRPVADSLLTLLAGSAHTTLSTHSVNGRTGLVASYGRRVTAVISLDVSGSHVFASWDGHPRGSPTTSVFVATSSNAGLSFDLSVQRDPGKLGITGPTVVSYTLYVTQTHTDSVQHR